MSDPRVSVVLPVRNGERYLDEAVESVARQDPPPAELIAVDDGSTDGTVAVLARHPLVRVLRQPATGAAAALNRAIAACSGDIVGFCDADDLWEPGRLRGQLDTLAEQPAAGIVGGLVVEFLSPDAPELAGTLRVNPAADRTRLLGSVLVRRDVLRDIGPLDETLRHGYNIDWMSRAEAAGVEVAWFDHVVLHRRIHTTNMGHDTEVARADLLQVLRRDRARRAGRP